MSCGLKRYNYKKFRTTVESEQAFGKSKESILDVQGHNLREVPAHRLLYLGIMKLT